MAEPRRYDDQEIEEILRRATEEDAGTPSAAPRGGTGLTLAEIEGIGAEVGIAPGRIAAAAQALERTGRPAEVDRYLGAPRSVSRTVYLDRPMTDAEWGRLVGDLRETFDAKGKVEHTGNLRSWSNSNLQIHVEPHGDSWRVRMSTRKGSATQFTMMATVFGAMGLFMAFEALLGGGGESVADAALFLAVAVGTIGWIRATLPGWAATRAEQMEGLAERILLTQGDTE